MLWVLTTVFILEIKIPLAAEITHADLLEKLRPQVLYVICYLLDCVPRMAVFQ